MEQTVPNDPAAWRIAFALSIGARLGARQKARVKDMDDDLIGSVRPGKPFADAGLSWNPV